MPVNLGLHQEFSNLRLENFVVYLLDKVVTVSVKTILKPQTFIDMKASIASFDFVNTLDSRLHIAQCLSIQIYEVSGTFNG
jgi:hypothetical protein